MKRRTFFRVALWAALAVALQAPIASVGAADGDDWIGTWTASPQPVWNARQTTHIVAGNKVGASDFKADSTVTSRLFLSGILLTGKR